MDFLTKHSVDLVLLDYRMPGLAGLTQKFADSKKEL